MDFGVAKVDTVAADDRRRVPGEPFLHVAGASRRATSRRPERPVRPRSGPLRAADGPEGVSRPGSANGLEAPGVRGSGRAQYPLARSSGGRRRGGGSGPGQGQGRSLSQREGPRRRHRGRSRGPPTTPSREGAGRPQDDDFPSRRGCAANGQARRAGDSETETGEGTVRAGAGRGAFALPPGKRVSLAFLSGTRQGEVFVLSRPTALIGRGAEGGPARTSSWPTPRPPALTRWWNATAAGSSSVTSAAPTGPSSRKGVSRKKGHSKTRASSAWATRGSCWLSRTRTKDERVSPDCA